MNIGSMEDGWSALYKSMRMSSIFPCLCLVSHQTAIGDLVALISTYTQDSLSCDNPPNPLPQLQWGEFWGYRLDGRSVET